MGPGADGTASGSSVWVQTRVVVRLLAISGEGV